MAQWYVKELSKLTNVTVQTLHHYDRIHLLKPSVRLPNGYRLYSEKDLLKLQQIIALKFFNFPLSQIKTLLSGDVDITEHFTMQSSFLEKKAAVLFEASQTLKNMVAECRHSQSIPWETLIKLIEVYRMTQALEETWIGKTLSSDELKEYVSFEREINSKFSEKEKKSFENGWHNLVNEVEANLENDPNSAFGIAMGERCIEWVNSYYGSKFASLRTTIWEKNLKDRSQESELGMSPEAANWLDKAMDAYAQDRVFAILSLIETYPQETVVKRWDEMLHDFFGDDQVKRKEFCLTLIDDNDVPTFAKDWIKRVI